MRILVVAVALLVIAMSAYETAESIASEEAAISALQLKGHKGNAGASATSESFAYSEDFTTTTFLDAANTTADWNTALGELGLYPYVPSLTGGCAIPGEPLYIFVEGNLAFIAAGAAGLQVVDITVVEQPQVVAQYTSPSAGSGRVVAVAVAGDFAFVADSQLGLEVLDILDTRNPVRIGGYDTGVGSRDVVIDDDLVVLAGPQGGLVLINVGIRATPVLLSKCTTPGVAQAVTLAGRIAFVADGRAGIQVVDISDRARPAIIGSIDTPGTALDIAVAGNRAYVADGDNVLVLDITEPANPVLIGGLAVPALSVRVSGNRAFVAGLASGLQVIDITHPANPSLDFSYNAGLSATLDVTFDGNLAFVADRGAGLRIVELSQPCPPTIMGTVDTPGIANDVAVSGNIAFVADGSSGLSIVDISDLRNPMLIGGHSLPYTAYGVAVAGDLVFVGETESVPFKNLPGGLYILDISDPTNPVRLGFTRCYAVGVEVAGQHAYVQDIEEGVKIFDIANPARPALAGRMYNAGFTLGLAIAGNLAVYTTRESTLSVHDISQPTKTPLLGRYYTDQQYGVRIVGDLLFLAAENDGLLILDISDPTNPTLVGTCDTNNAKGVAIAGNLALIADRHGGLRIIDISDPMNPAIIQSRSSGIGNPYNVTVDGDIAFVPRSSGLAMVRFLQDEVTQVTGVCQSTTIAVVDEPIVAVRLASDAVGDVAWEISATGGAHWQPIEPDSSWIRLMYPGTNLRWRATVEWGTVNPRVSKLDIDYKGRDVLPPPQERLMYVDIDATGTNDGSSWSNAFTDLQDALKVAAPGNEIWVAEGTYTPSQDKDWADTFSLMSGVGLFGGFDGSEAKRDERDWEVHPVVLNGDIGAGYDQNIRVIVTLVDCDSTTMLDGVVVSDGERGLHIQGGNPQILNATIRRNSSYGYGGGVVVQDGGRPLFRDVLFDRNTASMGGGIRVETGRIRVERSIFRNNYGTHAGGGVQGVGDFVDVLFVENGSDDAGGGVAGGGTFTNVRFWRNECIEGPGGGMAGGSDCVLTDVEFVGNNAIQGPGWGGGYAGSGKLTNVLFQDNVANWGGGMSCDRGGAELVNVSFVGNSVALAGGGLFVGDYLFSPSPTPRDPVSIINSTFVGNSAGAAGNNSEFESASIYTRGSTITIKNSVAWGNLEHPGGPPHISGDGATYLVSNSLIEGAGGSGASWNPEYGTDLGGNLDTDPLFVDALGGDLRLAPGSPAINAGDSGAVPTGIETDLDGNPRFIGAAVDMGAYEFQGSVQITDPPDKPELVKRYLYAAPNPFNPSTTISYAMPRDGQVELTIFDLAGRRVKVLVSEHVSAGEHEAQWHGRDESGKQVASGVYLYQLRARGFVETKRLVLVK